MRGGAPEAAPRPHRAVHPRGPARPVAADLRPDLHQDPGDTHRRHPVHRLHGARHHRPVRHVHRDLLRHPDHLGTGRGHPQQAPRHPDPALGADHRQGVRGRREIAGAGDRRDRHRRPARRRPDLEPAEAARRRGGRGAGLGVLLLPLDDHRGHRAQPRPADGLRAGDHHAAVLRLQRPVPGLGDAGLAAGRQQGQPAELSSGRAARAAARHARAPRRRLRGAGDRRGARHHGGLLTARQAGSVNSLRT
ncbi:hypothetical protein SGPA1_21237 [Streptomyces misionensis JCM 4497]